MHSKSAGIKTIRPKVLFGRVEAKFPGQNVGFRVNIPATSIGGMTLLESAVLVSLCRLVDPIDLFEFGTFAGATTLLLAENTRTDARVVTMDIPAEALADTPVPDHQVLDVLGSGDDNDRFLRETFKQQGAVCIDRADPMVRRKIEQRYQDSRTLDPAAQGMAGCFDYVLIDGGHDLDTIAIDTANAEKMIRGDAVVIWHDYGSKIHGDVTRFMQAYAPIGPTYHVEHTMLAFTLTGRHADELEG